jgi:predicted methyltransferase
MRPTAIVLSALSLAVVLAAPASAAPAPDGASGAAAAAIANPARPQKDRDRDAARKPGQVLAFAKVKPGDTVIDIWTGSGYWSRLFSKVVGPQGKVYAYVPSEIAGMKSKPMDVASALAAEPGYGNIQAISDPAASPPPPEYQATLNVAFIFQNYHDLHDKFTGPVDVAAYNRAIYQLLKPGGYYVIIDHAAKAGSGLANTDDLHRIDPATVRAEVEAAGFKLDATSDMLAASGDAHDKIVFDPSIRGKTDQFAMRFRKPA